MSSETVQQLSLICNAESVALVGASDKEGSFGRLFLEGLEDAASALTGRGAQAAR